MKANTSRWKWIRYVVLGYALLCGLFFAYQHLLYFQPKALDAKHVLTFPVRLRISSVKIPFDAETIIDVVKFLPLDSTQKPKGVVLFFHGNRYNVEHYSTYAPYFTRSGYEVWIPDYPGYGRSTGEMNVEILQDIATQLHKMARSQYEAEQVVLYGKSLGTGIAAYLASVRNAQSLILETPYYSLSSLTQSYAYFLPIPNLIRYNLKTGEYLKSITTPVTVLQGTKDELIPLENTLRLAPLLKPTDALYLIKGAKHNALPMYDAYHVVIDSVLQKSESR